MRTKALLLTAAVSAIGASVMAEVTSVNVVGFVNVTLPTDGWYIIANPLNNTNNTVGTLLNSMSGLPATADLYTYDPTAGYVNCVYYGDGVWDPDTLVLNPGQAFWLSVTSDSVAHTGGTVNAPFKITFIGEVPQGTLTTPLQVGWNMVASQVPQAGNLVTDLLYTVADDDDIYTWERTTLAPTGEWKNYPPDYAGGTQDPCVLGIGQGFFLFKSNPGSSWTRTFSVK